MSVKAEESVSMMKREMLEMKKTQIKLLEVEDTLSEIKIH